jgi:peroxiredoxin
MKLFVWVGLLAILLTPPLHAAGTLTPIPKRPPAPDFALKDAEGKLHRLSDQKGKVVLVNFWATWCPPCRKEMPSMQRAWDKLKNENFVMYAVNVGEDEDTIFGFTFAMGVELTFPILLDPKGKTVQEWPVLGLPTSFIVDADGRVAYRAVGGREWDETSLV